MGDAIFLVIWLAFMASAGVFWLWTYAHPFQSMRVMMLPMRWLSPNAPFPGLPGRVRYLWTHDEERDEDTPEARDWFRERRRIRIVAVCGALVAFGLLMTVPASLLVSLC